MGKHTGINSLLKRFKQLVFLKPALEDTVDTLIACYHKGGKILICGNGGSSADADHMVGELMKSFERSRPLNSTSKEKVALCCAENGAYLAEHLHEGIPALSLSANTALVSAISNDMGSDLVFAQQVITLARDSDVFIGFSTSGDSKNVINAMITAKALGLSTIALTGESGGRLKAHCDILINVPGQSTANIQELHLPVYHTICREVEDSLFNT